MLPDFFLVPELIVGVKSRSLNSLLVDETRCFLDLLLYNTFYYCLINKFPLFGGSRASFFPPLFSISIY